MQFLMCFDAFGNIHEVVIEPWHLYQFTVFENNSKKSHNFNFQKIFEFSSQKSTSNFAPKFKNSRKIACETWNMEHFLEFFKHCGYFDVFVVPEILWNLFKVSKWFFATNGKCYLDEVSNSWSFFHNKMRKWNFSKVVLSLDIKYFQIACST